MDNLKKYLPSKKFTTSLLIILILISLFLLIKGGISLLKKKATTDDKKIVEMTVGSIVQKDGNNNGIPDWEEYLWGLNPNKNGPENKEFILAKKKTLEQNGVISIPDDSQMITENELLSREFFSTIIALQQEGQLNEESIQSVSEAIGQKIEAVPISDVYSRDMLKIVSDSTQANKNYYNSFATLATKYENADIGSELTLISQGIGNNDPQALYAVKSVALAYRNFGKDLIQIPTPNAIASIHLSLANNYEKTAVSIEGLTQILNDPIVGMRAIINYKKYSDAIVSDIEKLPEILQ